MVQTCIVFTTALRIFDTVGEEGYGWMDGDGLLRSFFLALGLGVYLDTWFFFVAGEGMDGWMCCNEKR